MHHLQSAVIETDATRQISSGSDRQHFFDALARDVEINNLDRICLVGRHDLVGRTAASRQMTFDRNFDGCDGVGLHLAKFRSPAPVDRGIGQVKQHIDHTRFRPVEQPSEGLCELGADALQARQRRKQGIEDSGAHGGESGEGTAESQQADG
jgi:hypothetical protein